MGFPRFSHAVEESPLLEPALAPAVAALVRLLREMAAEPAEEAAAAVCFCVVQSLRGWLVPLLAPHLQTLMDILIAFLRRDPENALLLRTVAAATRFYAAQCPQAFYDVLRSVACVAAQSRMNSEEYVRELMGLFASFATVCCREFNADGETIQVVLNVCQGLLVNAGNRGKVAVLSFMNKLLRLEDDNDGIRFAFLNRMAELLDVEVKRTGHA